MSTMFTYLKQLIELVEREGDEHNQRKLWSLISRYAKEQVGVEKIPEEETGRLLAEVHELNMEQYIKVQAERFYESFPLPLSNKAQLIKDFIEMEHSRRRDDYEGFSLAVYQQIENIVNEVYRYFEIKKNFIEKKDAEVFQMKPGANPFNKDRKPVLIYQIIFKPPFSNYKTNTPLNDYEKEEYSTNKCKAFLEEGKFDFLDKARMVLYFMYFNQQLRNFDKWNELNNVIISINLSRNTVHRNINGEGASRAERKKDNHKYSNFLLFQGFLTDFTEGISSWIIKRGKQNEF